MRNPYSPLIMLLATALLAVGAGCGDDDDTVDIERATDTDIVGIAAGLPELETLTASLEAAGLTEALSAPGPFTVFAPTNAAFEQLPAGTIEDLTEDELTTVLNYHVVPELLFSEDLTAGPVATAAGLTAFVDTDGGVSINGVQVSDPDIEATNGVIHVIDEVLLPPDIIRSLELAGGFERALAAVERAGLTEALRGPGPFTVFVPTDEAFEALPEETVANLTQEQLRNVLLFHVVNDRLLSTDLSTGAVDTMLAGAQMPIEASGDTVRVGPANVVMPDIVATNGIIHAIDAVLVPPAPTP